jgi:PIN domain nuclease of toxin-antitoxin system
MSYLLDTHVWLWLAFEPQKIPPAVVETLRQEPCRLSTASIWEIAIKKPLGKLPMPVATSALVEKMGDAILSIQARHALAVEELPPLHRDPFDRMLVAQALSEGLCLVTADELVRQYAVPVLWAKA